MISIMFLKIVRMHMYTNIYFVFCHLMSTRYIVKPSYLKLQQLNLLFIYLYLL